MAYWLVRGPRGSQRPEVDAFCAWLMDEAAATRAAMGEVLKAGD